MHTLYQTPVPIQPVRVTVVAKGAAASVAAQTCWLPILNPRLTASPHHKFGGRLATHYEYRPILRPADLLERQRIDAPP